MAERFRLANQADLEGIVRLQTEYYREDGYPYHEDAARKAWLLLLADASLGRVWVIDSVLGPEGYLVVTFGYSLEYLGRDAFVDELYITPAARGQGLGREALAVAEAACLEAGVRALHLEVERGKEAAASLYRQSGFASRERVLMTKRVEA